MCQQEGRLATTFLRPLQTHFFVPDDGHKCTPKRLLDFCLSPGPGDDSDARELRAASESLVCSMFCSVEAQKRFFHLKVKTVFPLKAAHLLLRCRYLSKESSWKELAFHSRLSVWSKCDVSLFWVRRDLIQHDTSYRDRYRILVDFDLVHCDWFPPENPYFADKACQVYLEGAAPKNLPALPGFRDEQHHPDCNLVLVADDGRLLTLADLLTAVSPVFARMLNRCAELDEAGRRRLRLPGKSVAELEELLRLLHPATPHRLSLQHAPSVLTLAEEYQIDHLKETAEELIIHSFAAMHDSEAAASDAGGSDAPLDALSAHGQTSSKLLDSLRPSAMDGYALARMYNCQRLEQTCVQLLMDWSVEQIERHPVFNRMDKEDRCALALARMRIMESAAISRIH